MEELFSNKVKDSGMDGARGGHERQMHSNNYSTADYWNSRYKRSKRHYDWYVEYEQLKVCEVHMHAVLFQTHRCVKVNIVNSFRRTLLVNSSTRRMMSCTWSGSCVLCLDCYLLFSSHNISHKYPSTAGVWQ